MKFRTVLSLALAVLLVFSCLSPGVSALGEEEEPVQVRRYASFGSEQTDADALGITPAKYQQLLERIFGAIRAFESSCSIADFGILKTDASRECLSRIVFKEDPTLFQVGEVSFSYSPGTNAYTAINFRSYKYDKDAYVAMLAACDRAADQMTADLIDSGLSQAELALILHDRLAIRCGYDYDNYLNRTVPDESYTMYGPLVNRTAVCEGYSLAYRYLLARVGINSRLCVSEALNHAWNIVEIDGES